MSRTVPFSRRVLVVVAASMFVFTSCSSGGNSAGPPTTSSDQAVHTGSFDSIIPAPVSVKEGRGTFVLSKETTIVSDDKDAQDALRLLRDVVGRSTGYPLADAKTKANAGTKAKTKAVGPSASRIIFQRAAPDADNGDIVTGTEPPGPTTASTGPPEGFTIAVTPSQVTIAAAGHDGYIWAVQTLRQMLPAEVESTTRLGGTWTLPVGTIEDHPRLAWRGLLLDVARHFSPSERVKEVIDVVSAYKMNRLHLHLTDDQAWRIEIPDYPALTKVGASKAFTGEAGAGFYTLDEYRDLTRYAQARGVMIVPEIEMPSHSLAAITAIPSLRCPQADADRDEPDYDPKSTAAKRNLCPIEESTFAFLDTVIGRVADATPGRFIHTGGDEAFGMRLQDSLAFTPRAIAMVRSHGKIPIGWAEIVGLGPEPPDALLQLWNTPNGIHRPLIAKSAGVIASPSERTYINATYDAASKKAQMGWIHIDPVNTKKAYDWDPTTFFQGIPPNRVVGVETALWGDHISDRSRFDELLLPRLPGFGELGWSPQATHSWADYRVRLATQAARWDAWGQPYYPDPVVPWPTKASGNGPD